MINMNIGMVQLLSTKTVTPKQSVSNLTSNTTSVSKFGSMFDKVISSANQIKQSTQQENVPDETSIDEIVAILNVESLEELFDVLNITHDNGLLMFQIGEDSMEVPIEDMLNLEDLMASLNINAQELFQSIQQLLDEDQQASDVWELLAIVDGHAPLLQTEIVSALKGEGQVTQKEASQILKLLKLAELVGQKNDLTAFQENALITAKQFLLTMQTQIETNLIAQEVKTKSFETLPWQGNQQGVTQVIQTTQNTDKSTNEMITPNTVQINRDHFQITLPTQKTSQSEALLKEMQALLNKTQISNAQGITRLTLKLYPENLGTIRIELSTNNGLLTARLLASTAHGRELLDNQSNQLKLAFSQQNIQLDRLDIAQALQDTDRQQRDQHFFSNFFKQQHQQEEQKDERDEDDTVSFSEYLINEEV